MIITKKALPRRTFLRGMGTALALPLLDAMLPSMTALADTPAAHAKRLGFFFVPLCGLPLGSVGDQAPGSGNPPAAARNLDGFSVRCGPVRQRLCLCLPEQSFLV